jgi:multidrug efflux system outer membrane protein
LHRRADLVWFTEQSDIDLLSDTQLFRCQLASPIGINCHEEFMPPSPIARHAQYMRKMMVACTMSLLGACAAVAPPQPSTAMDDVPAAWSAQADRHPPVPTALSQWWLRFDDALLSDLIGQALLTNTSVAGAQASLRQARALADASGAARLPAVVASASAQHRAGGGEAAGNRIAAGLDASWELDIFGANRSAFAASNAIAAASAASLAAVHVSVSAEVALDYIAMRGAQARLAIARDNLASQQTTFTFTEWRWQAGLVSALELEQARSAVEQTSAQLPAFQSHIEQWRHALAVLTGRPPAALDAALAAAGPVPQAGDGLSLPIPADTLRQRPDVRAAEHRVAAAVARLAQANAARWPDFRLGGSMGLSGVTLSALSSGATLAGTVLAGMSMSLFDGGALRAQVRAQQGALDLAGAAYRASVLTALQEVEDGLAALRGDRERLARLRLAAEAAGQAARMASQRFRSGIVDFQVVLATQRAQLITQDSVASANTDVSTDQVRLYKALGGGWNPATPAP